MKPPQLMIYIKTIVFFPIASFKYANEALSNEIFGGI